MKLLRFLCHAVRLRSFGLARWVTEYERAEQATRHTGSGPR